MCTNSTQGVEECALLLYTEKLNVLEIYCTSKCGIF